MQTKDQIDPNVLRSYAKDDLMTALENGEINPEPEVSDLENWIDRQASFTEWEIYAEMFIEERQRNMSTLTTHLIDCKIQAKILHQSSAKALELLAKLPDDVKIPPELPDTLTDLANYAEVTRSKAEEAIELHNQKDQPPK